MMLESGIIWTPWDGHLVEVLGMSLKGIVPGVPSSEIMPFASESICALIEGSGRGGGMTAHRARMGGVHA